jgi:hypothetical protein
MDTIDRDETSAKSAATQRRDEEKTLRARPVKGKIDYAELIRETIAKFPKILAALAK